MFLNADGNLLKIEAALCWNVPVSFGTNSNGASDDLKLCVCTLRSSNDKYSGKSLLWIAFKWKIESIIEPSFDN